MDIRVRRENHQILMRLAQVQFEIYRKKTFHRFLKSGLWAVGFMAAGIWEIGSFGSIWNPMFAFGIGVLFTIYLAVGLMIKWRKDAVVKAAQKIAKLMRQGSILEVSFTDAIIDYRDSDLYFQANWSYYSSYILHKECLFIINDKERLNGVAIGKEELSAEAWFELLDFLGRKLPVLQKI